MKNVSWASRAGCCWGWNNASKFQNELSTKLFVGISSNLIYNPINNKLFIMKLIIWSLQLRSFMSYPISKNIFLNSARTLSKGCKWPVSVEDPSASKLYFLNFFSFHAPFINKSLVNSVSNFSIFVAKFGPFLTMTLLTML